MEAPCPAANLLECAVEAARAASGHANRNGHRRQEAVARLEHDIKLRLDFECQEIAETVIRQRFPDHLILGEETPQHEPAKEQGDSLEWIIDPIDGTVNFSHGLPFWCSSVAVRQGDNVLAGAVSAPALNELFTATIEDGARLNGVPVRVSETSELASAVVMTGLDKNIAPELAPFTVFKSIASNVQRARITGSAALDICHVAAGWADGYFESGIYLWDIAAGALMVRQAGGRTEVLARHGRHRLRFMASNGHLHAALRRIIEDPLSVRG